VKRIIPVCLLATFLTGCPMGDRIPPRDPAEVLTVANSVCIRVQPQGEARMNYLWIEEIGNKDHLLQKANIGEVPVSPQKCIPTYGYVFQPGKAYNVSLSVELKDASNGSLTSRQQTFTSSFIIWTMADRWQVSER